MSRRDALDSLSPEKGDGSLHVILLPMTQLVRFKHFISVYLKVIYSKNLCDQCFSEELHLFSFNEDKPMLMLFKMDENVTKDRLWSSKMALNC